MSRKDGTGAPRSAGELALGAARQLGGAQPRLAPADAAVLHAHAVAVRDMAVAEDQQQRHGLRRRAHAGRIGEPVAHRAGLDRGLVVGEVAAGRGDGEHVGDREVRHPGSVYRTTKLVRRAEPPGADSVSVYLPAASSLPPWRRLRSNPRAVPESRTRWVHERAPAQRMAAVTGVSALSA